jgi:hypothetical protein
MHLFCPIYTICLAHLTPTSLIASGIQIKELLSRLKYLRCQGHKRRLAMLG